MTNVLTMPVSAFANAKKTITKDEYQLFCKEFLFDQLKEISFTEAFCKKFDIDDIVLQMKSSNDTGKFLIETLGYIK